jgi:hypothetical protein
MNAKLIHATLEAWDAVGHLVFSDRQFMQAEAELCQAVKSALLALDGVDDVTFERGSAGSIYFECEKEVNEDDTARIMVRVSNHDAGKRGCENAANIVVGDSVREIELQLAKAAKAMAENIDFVLS